MLPLFLSNLMVNSFAIIGSRLAINCIEFWGVTPCNLVDYVNVVAEYVIEHHVILKCIVIYVLFHYGLKRALIRQLS
jgi:hypothetical protein